ncbi:hypothetical protein PG985_014575 [Apiospora marii]|uniref:Uncharacterized protein n=1 Tax=Apiospora marii TaxID=335849 RepID=A0ABR1R6G7_9PEZI
MANPQPFQGKVICITGAAQGIGLATAEYLAARGATLSLCDMSFGEEGGAMTDGLSGADNMTMYADVCNPVSVKAWVEATVEKFGRLDGCVNNAGVAPRKMVPITEMELDDWNRVVGVNLTGVFNCLKYEMQHIADEGSIVNVASVAGLKGAARFSSYIASKHGVVGLTKAAACDGAPRKIRVNAVCPAPIQTAMHTHLDNEGLYPKGQEGLSAMLLPKLGQPEEVAASIAFFLSDETKFLTQVLHPVDGGFAGC